MTLSAEVLRRHVSELHDVTLVAAPHPTIDRLDILRLTAGTDAVSLSSAVAGFKWNVTGTFVLGGHVSFALAKTRPHRTGDADARPGIRVLGLGPLLRAGSSELAAGTGP